MAHKFSFCKACETPLDCDFCDKLETLEERKHGYWVKIDRLKVNPSWVVRCSLCGCPQDYKHNFCPHCGAQMDKEVQS